MFEDEFAQLLQDYTDAVADKKRINGLLHDMFPSQPMQMNLLSVAYDLDIDKAIFMKRKPCEDRSV